MVPETCVSEMASPRTTIHVPTFVCLVPMHANLQPRSLFGLVVDLMAEEQVRGLLCKLRPAMLMYLLPVSGLLGLLYVCFVCDVPFIRRFVHSFIWDIPRKEWGASFRHTAHGAPSGSEYLSRTPIPPPWISRTVWQRLGAFAVIFLAAIGLPAAFPAEGRRQRTLLLLSLSGTLLAIQLLGGFLRVFVAFEELFFYASYTASCVRAHWPFVDCMPPPAWEGDVGLQPAAIAKEPQVWEPNPGMGIHGGYLLGPMHSRRPRTSMEFLEALMGVCLFFAAVWLGAGWPETVRPWHFLVLVPLTYALRWCPNLIDFGRIGNTSLLMERHRRHGPALRPPWMVPQQLYLRGFQFAVCSAYHARRLPGVRVDWCLEHAATHAGMECKLAWESICAYPLYQARSCAILSLTIWHAKWWRGWKWEDGGRVALLYLFVEAALRHEPVFLKAAIPLFRTYKELNNAVVTAFNKGLLVFARGQFMPPGAGPLPHRHDQCIDYPGSCCLCVPGVRAP